MARAVDDPVWAGHECDDDRIVRLALSPGGDALELLYRRYAAQVWRLCRSRLRDDADADDACQETLLRAHRALPRFRAGAPMWPWLATIARNVCTDMHRARRCESLDAQDLEDGDLLAEDRSDPHSAVVHQLRSELVGDALRALPASYRATIHLRDLEGRSYAEIAELEGSTVATVRGNLHRGRRALKERVRTLAAGRGMWPLPSVLGGFLGLPSWLRRNAAGDPNTVGFVSSLGATLGPVGANLATAVAVVATVGGAMTLPSAAAHDAGVSPLSMSISAIVASGEAAATDSGHDEPADPEGGSAPSDDAVLSPVNPVTPAPPADASAGLDGDGVVSASASAEVDDGSENEDDTRAEGWFNLACDRTEVHQQVCDALEEDPVLLPG